MKERTPVPTNPLTCRPYQPPDRAACLALFDGNVPEAFAASERADYTLFLEEAPTGYQVCCLGERIVGAFGLSEAHEERRGRVRWILTDAAQRGRGVGRHMMLAVRAQARRAGLHTVDIAASQKSAPFFARFGAEACGHVPDGWGPGLDRVDMVWQLG